TLGEWIEEQNVRASAQLDAHVLISEEAIDKIKRAMGAWNSRDASGDAGRMIELMDSASNITSETKGSGLEYLADACFSMIGVAQDSEWSESMDNETYLRRGLTTRFIPGGIGV